MTARPRTCFYVDETMHTPNGFVPSLVTEGAPGYAPMVGSGEHAQPWYWGDDLDTAKRIAADVNAERELTAEDCEQIVSSSIAAQIHADSHREAAHTRWEQIKEGRAPS